MTIYIYGLSDPRDGRIRYVGKTNNIQRRLESHIYDMPGANPRKERWIQSLINKAMKPEIVILEECQEGEWQEREIYWIAEYKSIYSDITNLTSGGDSSWDSIRARNVRVSQFAKKHRLRIYKCYSCKGKTISPDCICRYCLRILSHDYQDEWTSLFVGSSKWRKLRADRDSEIPFSDLSGSELAGVLDYV